MNAPIEEALRKLEGGSTLVRIFDYMSVAEEAITAAKDRYRVARRKIHNAFLLLTPGVLIDYGKPLYRSHCDEILTRVARKADTRDPTRAEMCVALCEISLKGPLSRDPAALYERLFREVFPGHPIVTNQESLERESYPGACDEIEDTLRRRLRQEDRVVKKGVTV
jgi:hypothetical protein